MARILAVTTSESVTLSVTDLNDYRIEGDGAVFTFTWTVLLNGVALGRGSGDSATGGVNTGGEITWGGLTANTRYDVWCYIYVNGLHLDTIKDTFATDADESGGGGSTSSDASLEITSLTKSTVTLRLINLDMDYAGTSRVISFYIQADSEPLMSDTNNPYNISNYNPEISSIGNYIDEDYAAETGKTNEEVITGLTPGTEYYVLCVVTNNPITWFYSTKLSFTTPTASGVGDGGYSFRTYSFGTITSTVSHSADTTKNTLNRWTVSFAHGGMASFIFSGDMDEYYVDISDSDEYDFKNLLSVHRLGHIWYNRIENVQGVKQIIQLNVKKNTTYYITTSDYSEIGWKTGLTVIPPSSTPDFEWSSAITQGKPFAGLMANEWNDFIDKIVDVLYYKNCENEIITTGQYGYEAGTSFTEMIEDQYVNRGDTLTALMFNIVKNCIGTHKSTGIQDKKPGDFVLADDFHTLATKLNEWKNG